MTNEHKYKISVSCKGISKNNGKIWVTNGYDTTRILPEDVDLWLSKGYTRGKKLINRPQVAWNKGLKACDDVRVLKMRRLPKINHK